MKIKKVVEVEVDGAELVAELRAAYQREHGVPSSPYKIGDAVLVGSEHECYAGKIGIIHSERDGDGDHRVFLFEDNGSTDVPYIHGRHLTAFDEAAG